MGPEWVVFVVIGVIVLLVATSARRSGIENSTVGHYDPDAIGRYVMDPATQTYRYELPNVAKDGGPVAHGGGPPHRRRRRARRTGREGG
jgi:hypothetical protein